MNSFAVVIATGKKDYHFPPPYISEMAVLKEGKREKRDGKEREFELSRQPN